MSMETKEPQSLDSRIDALGELIGVLENGRTDPERIAEAAKSLRELQTVLKAVSRIPTENVNPRPWELYGKELYDAEIPFGFTPTTAEKRHFVACVNLVHGITKGRYDGSLCVMPPTELELASDREEKAEAEENRRTRRGSYEPVTEADCEKRGVRFVSEDPDIQRAYERMPTRYKDGGDIPDDERVAMAYMVAGLTDENIEGVATEIENMPVPGANLIGNDAASKRVNKTLGVMMLREFARFVRTAAELSEAEGISARPWKVYGVEDGKDPRSISTTICAHDGHFIAEDECFSTIDAKHICGAVNLVRRLANRLPLENLV